MQNVKNSSRLLAILLTFVMAFGLAPTFMVAASSTITVYISFEGYNLGHGFYIEPTAIAVPAGSTAEIPTRQLLTERGHTFSGDSPLGFFLDNISGFNRGYINPPEYISERITLANHVEEGGYLGAFMFSQYSGWAITVNHFLIDLGAAAWQLNDGDVIRWQFSVYGLGADLGVLDGFGGEPLYEHADKTELIRALFLPGIDETARLAALDVIINPIATAAQVENATSALLDSADWSADGYFNGWYVVHNPNGDLRDRLLRIVDEKYGLTPLNLPPATSDDVVPVAYIPQLRERLSVVRRLRVVGTMNTHDFRPGNAAAPATATFRTGLLTQHSNTNINFTVPGGFFDPPTDTFPTHAAILNNLVEIDLSSVTSIIDENGLELDAYPNRAFRGLRNVERIRLPANRALVNGMFQFATSLSELTFGDMTFVDNTFDFRGLENLTFGGSFNFEHTAAREIIFPAGVTNIPNSMFIRSANLQTVHFYGETAPAFGTNVFNNINPRPSAVVPNNQTDGYELSGFFNHFSLVISRDGGGLDLMPLFALRNSAVNMDSAAYMPESWNNVAVAISDAQLVLYNISSETTQDEVNYAFNALQAAIDALVVRLDNVTFINIPAGANIGVFTRGVNHFAPFTVFSITLDEEATAGAEYGREVWRTAVPTGQAFHIEAYIPGETAKLARRMNALSEHGTTITLNLTPLSDWVNGRGTRYHNANVYTNLGDCGSINLAVGQTFDLDTFRVWQAMDGVLLSYFIEPEYVIEVFGESASYSRIGSPGREQFRITALEPGVSVIKITYNPVEYVRANGTSLFFDAIDSRNTLVIPINVVAAPDDIPSFETGITVRNDFDTYYYDISVGYREFTFTPASGSSVRVHEPLNKTALGIGWTNYTANTDGSFTVRLHSGRNIIEVTNDGAVRHHIVHARGVTVLVENLTNPNRDYFTEGDTARISITGLMKPVEKLAGIYNPGFSGGWSTPNLRAFIRYHNGVTAIESDRALVGQFSTLTDTFTVTYTLNDASLNVLNGRIHVGHMGSELGAHRSIPLNGVLPNFDAVAVGPFPFGALPEIVLPLYGSVTTELIYLPQTSEWVLRVYDPGLTLTEVTVIAALRANNLRFQAGEILTVQAQRRQQFDILLNDISLISCDSGHELRIFVWRENMVPLIDGYRTI